MHLGQNLVRKHHFHELCKVSPKNTSAFLRFVKEKLDFAHLGVMLGDGAIDVLNI